MEEKTNNQEDCFAKRRVEELEQKNICVTPGIKPRTAALTVPTNEQSYPKYCCQVRLKNREQLSDSTALNKFKSLASFILQNQ